MNVVFPKRFQRQLTEDFLRRVWKSKCGRFKVVWTHVIPGERSRNPIADRVYAEVRIGERWDIISRNRTIAGAMGSCQKLEEIAGQIYVEGPSIDEPDLLHRALREYRSRRQKKVADRRADRAFRRLQQTLRSRV